MAKILVIGDIILDHYIHGHVKRISPEAPIPIVKYQKSEYRLGGAANVFVNIAQTGIDVNIIGLVGDDIYKDEIFTLCKKFSLPYENILIDDTRPTTLKTRILGNNQQIVRLDQEESYPISTELENSICYHLYKEEYDVIVLSDYNRGTLTPKICQSAIRSSAKVIVDPKGKNFEKYQNAYMITPNRQEAEYVTESRNLDYMMDYFQNTLNISCPIITLSKDGIAYRDQNNSDNSISESKTIHIMPTEVQNVVDVTGAGDIVVAILAYGLANNLNIASTISHANNMATESVKEVGTSIIDPLKFFKMVRAENDILESDNIPNSFDCNDWINILEIARVHNKIIAFTNGCFDILHIGHVQYLQEAKKQCDILIVGVNSDASMTRIKRHPTQSCEERMAILLELESVDFVCSFDQDTPYELIQFIRPNILIKGGDYEVQKIVGYDIVSKVITIPHTGHSTTKIIERLNETSFKK